MISFLFVPVALLGVVSSFASHAEPVFACDMNALTKEERQEISMTLDQLVAAAPAVRELRNGYEIQFRGSKGVFPLAAKWISLESRCCSFLDFEVSLRRIDGPLTIRMTGPAGVKEFIAAELPKLHQLTKVNDQ